MATGRSDERPLTGDEIESDLTMDRDPPEPSAEFVDHDSGSDAPGIDVAPRVARRGIDVRAWNDAFRTSLMAVDVGGGENADPLSRHVRLTPEPAS